MAKRQAAEAVTTVTEQPKAGFFTSIGNFFKKVGTFFLNTFKAMGSRISGFFKGIWTLLSEDYIFFSLFTIAGVMAGISLLGAFYTPFTYFFTYIGAIALLAGGVTLILQLGMGLTRSIMDGYRHTFPKPQEA